MANADEIWAFTNPRRARLDDRRETVHIERSAEQGRFVYPAVESEGGLHANSKRPQATSFQSPQELAHSLCLIRNRRVAWLPPAPAKLQSAQPSPERLPSLPASS